MSPLIRTAEVEPSVLPDSRFSEMTVRILVDADRVGSQFAVAGHSTFPAGRTTHEAHSHPNAEELIVVLSGRGRQRVGDEIFDIAQGDVVFVPRGTVHVAESAEDEELVMVWIYAGAATMAEAGYEGTSDFGGVGDRSSDSDSKK